MVSPGVNACLGGRKVVAGGRCRCDYLGLHAQVWPGEVALLDDLLGVLRLQVVSLHFTL